MKSFVLSASAGRRVGNHDLGQWRPDGAVDLSILFFLLVCFCSCESTYTYAMHVTRDLRIWGSGYMYYLGRYQVTLANTSYWRTPVGTA